MDRLAAMHTFVKVIETGSFSAAARQLRVGQPSISKTVAQLEQRLGVSLLLRSSRSLSTTEAGQIFYERAKLTIAEADEAELAARGAGAALHGRLRVSAAVTLTRLKIAPKLGRFLAQHPKLEIELILDDRDVDLVGEGIDVALRMGALKDSTLTARKISDVRRRVVGTPVYFADSGVPLRPHDLDQHEAIIYTQRGGGVTWTFVKDANEENVSLNGRIRSTAAEAVREAVLANLGLAVVSDCMLGDELKSGAVREVLADWRLPSIDIWAVFPTGRRASAKARAFAEFVQLELTGAAA
ncbi:transcriptional regulator [Bradyrhizobium jicamae]|uniref:Transcriptional regulator n=1 Tax=Bradyrhizobium jicamae TaxID=280332 RepID=A0A0R3KJ07_9BRAD|nr:LysR family transcriptional regulator [Bradyrhizobium jicamae]KRQ94829.1 transcriptional regulator [Bradyrhizobium jicamae]